jgi:hypothetical protein
MNTNQQVFNQKNIIEIEFINEKIIELSNENTQLEEEYKIIVSNNDNIFKIKLNELKRMNNRKEYKLYLKLQKEYNDFLECIE